MGSNKNAECALDETYGSVEHNDDSDNQRLLDLKRQREELEGELMVSVNILSELLGQTPEVIKPVAMQFSLNTGLQELTDAVADKLQIPSVHIFAFMQGRQDFLFDFAEHSCRVWRSKTGKLHWTQDKDVSLGEKWARGYIAGWEFAKQQFSHLSKSSDKIIGSLN